jgi:hypothetical protein
MVLPILDEQEHGEGAGVGPSAQAYMKRRRSSASPPGRLKRSISTHFSFGTPKSPMSVLKEALRMQTLTGLSNRIPKTTYFS